MTDKQYITIFDETAYIKDVNNDQVLYSIRRQELPLKRDDDTSEWIMQLMDKTWIALRTLYRLAQMIDQEFPENRIDWRKTFFIVEKSNYLDSLSEVMTKKHDSITKNLFEQIEFGRQETNDETHNIIDEILTKSLVEFKLD